MNLILFLFAFVIERKTHVPFSYVFDRASSIFVASLSARFKRLPEWLGLVFFFLIFLVLVTGVYGGLFLLQDVLYGGFYFFAVFLLVLSLIGDPHSASELDAFLTHWRREESQAALQSLQKSHIVFSHNADSPQLLLRDVVNWLLLQTFQRYFLILFWFAVTGPAGALVARIVEQACQPYSWTPSRRALTPILSALEFVPGRLVAIAMVFLSNRASLNWQFFQQVIFVQMRSVRLLLVSAQVALPHVNLGKRDRMVTLVVDDDALLQNEFTNSYQTGDQGIQALRVLLTQVVWGCFLVWASVQLGCFYFLGR
ncbi:MAG: hypothetical protein CSA50_04090 [Gammaproteobacteria bacterium]|nr:MAG: hypothetical protein CSA50_04090 [Gammaproteobacteria bacterium]